MIRRLVATVASTFVCVLGLCVVPLAPASAAPPDVQTFSDPFSGEFSCPGFDAVFVGQDRGRITNFFDRNGELVRQVGHIHAVETDTNLSTGVSVRVDTNITVHADLLPDGSFGTFSITGQFNVATRPGRGIVLHDTGRVEFDGEGNPVVFRGVHDTFTKGEQAFCDALS